MLQKACGNQHLLQQTGALLDRARSLAPNASDYVTEVIPFSWTCASQCHNSVSVHTVVEYVFEVRDVLITLYHRPVDSFGSLSALP